MKFCHVLVVVSVLVVASVLLLHELNFPWVFEKERCLAMKNFRLSCVLLSNFCLNMTLIALHSIAIRTHAKLALNSRLIITIVSSTSFCSLAGKMSSSNGDFKVPKFPIVYLIMLKGNSLLKLFYF